MFDMHCNINCHSYLPEQVEVEEHGCTHAQLTDEHHHDMLNLIGHRCEAVNMVNISLLLFHHAYINNVNQSIIISADNLRQAAS